MNPHALTLSLRAFYTGCDFCHLLPTSHACMQSEGRTYAHAQWYLYFQASWLLLAILLPHTHSPHSLQTERITLFSTLITVCVLSNIRMYLRCGRHFFSQPPLHTTIIFMQTRPLPAEREGKIPAWPRCHYTLMSLAAEVRWKEIWVFFFSVWPKCFSV